MRPCGGEIQKRSAYCKTNKNSASTMLVAAGRSEPYWECEQDYSKIIHNRTVRPYGESDEGKSLDDIFYGTSWHANASTHQMLGEYHCNGGAA